jgi:hypothetical protein
MKYTKVEVKQAVNLLINCISEMPPEVADIDRQISMVRKVNGLYVDILVGMKQLEKIEQKKAEEKAEIQTATTEEPVQQVSHTISITQ